MGTETHGKLSESKVDTGDNQVDADNKYAEAPWVVIIIIIIRA